MTQFERIKTMTIEELAEEMNNADYCEGFCEHCEKGTGLCRAYERGKPMYECCVAATIKYLKSEVQAVTKFEQIKEMTAEELSGFLGGFDKTEFCKERFCIHLGADGVCAALGGPGSCISAAENWLKSEVADNAPDRC